MKTPYIGFGYETLDGLPQVQEGDEIDCPICNGKHRLEAGTSNGKKSTLLLFYKCGYKSYLAAISGALTMGTKADISGTL